MWGIPVSEFHFAPMSQNDLLNLYRKSRIIVDMQHPNQTGLTLRTMEALGSKKKLITTNPDIVNYDFFDPQNILVVDRKKPDISEHFFRTTYSPIPKNIYEKYSVDSWLDQILN